MTSQSELETSICTFISLEMTDAAVAIYTLLYRDLPARIAPPEIEENESTYIDVNYFNSGDIADQIDKDAADLLKHKQNTNWLYTPNILNFIEYFEASTLKCEKPERLYEPIHASDDLYKFKIKKENNLQVWEMLKEMLKRSEARNDIYSTTDIKDFLSLNRQTQIALLKAVAGFSEFAPNDKYNALISSIDNLRTLGAFIPINEVPFSVETLSNMLNLFTFVIPSIDICIEPSDWSKSSEFEDFDPIKVFKLLHSFNDLKSDPMKCFYYLYPVANLKLTTAVLESDIKNLPDLEDLLRQNGRDNKPRHQI